MSTSWRLLSSNVLDLVIGEEFWTGFFNHIQQELRMMLNSQTRNNWDDAYLITKEKLYDFPEKLELLEEIFHDPKYYSGYHLRTIQRSTERVFAW